MKAKTIEVRKTVALERIAEALEQLEKFLTIPSAQPWLSEHEEAAFLKSVGDDVP